MKTSSFRFYPLLVAVAVLLSFGCAGMAQILDISQTGSSILQLGGETVTSLGTPLFSGSGVIIFNGTNQVFVPIGNAIFTDSAKGLTGSASIGSFGTLAVTGGHLFTVVHPTGGTSVVITSGTTTLTNGSVFIGGSLVFSGGSITHGMTTNNLPATIITGGSVTLTNGTTALPAPQLSVVATKGDLAPGIPGAKFTQFGPATINSGGNSAFQAVVSGSGANVLNNAGIWANDDSGTLQLVVRTGTSAPGTNGAVFSVLGDPVFNNNNCTAFLGTLRLWVGDATVQPLNNTTGIWSNDGGTLHLVARSGGQAPGCPAGTTFLNFSQFALPDQGGVVMLATIKSNTPAFSNAQGVWAVDTSGNLDLVILEGNQVNVNGVNKTVSGLTFLPAVQHVGGQTRSFDQTTGDILLYVTFKDGTSAIMKVTFP